MKEMQAYGCLGWGVELLLGQKLCSRGCASVRKISFLIYAWFFYGEIARMRKRLEWYLDVGTWVVQRPGLMARSGTGSTHVES